MKAREIAHSVLRRWPLGALALVVALAFGLAGQVVSTPLTAATTVVTSPVITRVHYIDIRNANDPNDDVHVVLPCFNVYCLNEQIGSVGQPDGTLVVHDQAIVVSSDINLNPTGNIQFAFFTGTLHCMGRPLFTEKIAITALGGVGEAESSSSAPLLPGDYSYRALYQPDKVAKDLGFSNTPGPCEQLRLIRAKHDTVIHFPDHTALECFNAPACTGLPEQQGPANSIVHDQATVDSTQTNRTPTGKVTFGFFVGTPHCEGTPAFPPEDVVVSAGSGQVVVYESSPTLALAPGVYSYKAVYTPDAAAIALGIGSVPAPCEQLLILAGP